MKRLELLANIKVTLSVLILIAQHLKTAGIAVIYAYYFSKLYPKGSVVNIVDFIEKFLPVGFFTEKQLEEIWKIQKVRPDDDIEGWHCFGVPDNLLDYTEIWNDEISLNNN